MSKINKKEILLRIIPPPKKQIQAFFSREYKILNRLLKEFPNLDFWAKVNFNQDWDSIKILQDGFGRALLEKKYKEFHHKLPTEPHFKISKKSGKDKNINIKPNTIRDFLS